MAKASEGLPKDPLVSKASHYLGVCYMQQAKPNYAAASEAFAQALADQKLEIRDESLINLGWCQFMQARSTEADPAAQKKLYQQSRETLTDYVKSYPQGSSVDQALFFSGEIEYSLGNSKQAIDLYEQLIKNKSLASSSWKSDAQYALGVAYEQLKQDAQARTVYEAFLNDNREHRLRSKVALRLADILLRTGAPAEAEKLFAASGCGGWTAGGLCHVAIGTIAGRARQVSRCFQDVRTNGGEVSTIGACGHCQAFPLGKCISGQANIQKPPRCSVLCSPAKAIKVRKLRICWP